MGRRVFSGRFVLPAGALLCLFALYVALYPGTLYAQAADLHKQAQKLASQKKTAEADAMYLKALDAAPEDGSINADYGQFLLWQKKDPASALVRFDRALAVKYERTWIHRQRGQALASLHQYEQAEAALKEALKSAEKEMAKSKGQAAGEKNFVQASGILAQLYVDRDRYRDAVD
ncbi:MAG: tetratricopeptide repeat protein, partial [Spirochaetia bacterium]|nr:tetratricopeptide repeat protein [Spirochaetia bacterium]